MSIDRRGFVLFLAGACGAFAQLTPEIAKAAVARFEGKLRTYDKKQFVLETDDGQTLTFRRTKSTKIVPKDLQLGIQVQIAAHKNNVGDLEAMQVCAGTCSGGK